MFIFYLFIHLFFFFLFINRNNLLYNPKCLNSILFPRNIRPKTAQSVTTSPSSFSSYVAAITKTSSANSLTNDYLQNRLNDSSISIESRCGGNKVQIGRQGPIKDVKSLIDDFRQQHPEQVPRRGRRMKNINQYVSEQQNVENADLSSPPTSNDSSYNSHLPPKGLSNTFGSLSTSKLLILFLIFIVNK